MNTADLDASFLDNAKMVTGSTDYFIDAKHLRVTEIYRPRYQAMYGANEYAKPAILTHFDFRLQQMQTVFAPNFDASNSYVFQYQRDGGVAIGFSAIQFADIKDKPLQERISAMAKKLNTTDPFPPPEPTKPPLSLRDQYLGAPKSGPKSG